MKTVKLFDCDVANLTMKETLDEIEKIIQKGQVTQHVVINAGKIVQMSKDQRLKEIVKNCPIINADGQSIVWASKLLNKPLPERVAGIDLMDNLIRISAKKKYGIYFFGAKEDVVREVIKKYKYKYPTLKVSGYRNGYFNEEDISSIVNDMRKSNADILFVAFSSPKKEYWLSENIDKINIPFCMGVGGSFDVIAGKTKRAPKWMQRIGLEWFYRFLQEPGRMWKRYLVGNTKFGLLTLREFINKK